MLGKCAVSRFGKVGWSDVFHCKTTSQDSRGEGKAVGQPDRGKRVKGRVECEKCSAGSGCLIAIGDGKSGSCSEHG